MLDLTPSIFIGRCLLGFKTIYVRYENQPYTWFKNYIKSFILYNPGSFPFKKMAALTAPAAKTSLEAA